MCMQLTYSSSACMQSIMVITIHGVPLIVAIWAREFIVASGVHRFVHIVTVVAIDVTEHAHQLCLVVPRFACHSVLAVV